jgi:site-specific recombinase XerD
MYATHDPKCCPVEILRLLIEKTDSNASHLFNHYYKDRNINADKWFTAKPLSKRTYANFLGEICIASGVQKKYSPHCLRATAIIYLNDSGFEARHIMFMISNHKNESSLQRVLG